MLCRNTSSRTLSGESLSRPTPNAGLFRISMGTTARVRYRSGVSLNNGENRCVKASYVGLDFAVQAIVVGQALHVLDGCHSWRPCKSVHTYASMA